MTNWPNWLTTQNYIGSQYPFYSINEETPFFSLNFNEVTKKSSLEKPELEVQSVIEILMRSYIIGDKTLIKGINRAPWLAEFNNKSKEWNYFDVPKHKNKIIDPKDAAVTLKKLLYEEIIHFIGDVKKVGILLSGGMDSRILAGILKQTQINKDFNGDVIVYNWGVTDSRDVWYAKKIADGYGWSYKYFPLNPDILKDNFYLVQKVGAEIMPFNLHAMGSVAEDYDSEIVLAGSYGDTLGRAEYNGIPLKKAPPIVLNNANKLGLLKEELVKEHYEKMVIDSVSYRGSVDKHWRKEYQYRETEYQRHHSRRYLNTAMSIIAEKKPMYQLFTSPKVVEFLWGLDVSLRSNKLYENLLPLLPGKISQIPWSRTGKIFGSNEDENLDNLKSASHEYGSWLRSDLKSFIDKELDFNLFISMGIFNEKSLDKIYSAWSRLTPKSITKMDGTISWLTAFSIFIKKNNVVNHLQYKNKIKDELNSFVLVPKIKGHQYLKDKLRNNSGNK